MKAIVVQRICCMVALLSVGVLARAEEKALHVYNWPDYIAQDTVARFQKETGIQVKYDIYDSDETLQAKLLAGRTGYDIVVPTSNYMAKQIEAGLYLKLDKSKLPNLRYLDPNLMYLVADADPGNQYAVPWAWGTDGLGYNVTKVRTLLGDDVDLASWDILFKLSYLSKLQSCGISVLDQAPDVFSVALHYLGKDPNSTRAADYRAAYELLKKIRPYIKQFSSSGYINDLVNGDICFAFGWSGDMTIARSRVREANKPYTIQYFIPKRGAPIWFDMMAIPKDAPHPEAALAWINYIETPQVHAGITNEVFYPNANLEAKRFVKADVASDPTIYPPPNVLKTLFLLKPIPAEILRLENRLWSRLKAAR